jgi:hypothetical protein
MGLDENVREGIMTEGMPWEGSISRAHWRSEGVDELKEGVGPGFRWFERL